MSQMSIRRRPQRRLAMKENKLGWVCLNRETSTKLDLARAMTKSRSEMQTVTMDVWSKRQ